MEEIIKDTGATPAMTPSSTPSINKDGGKLPAQDPKKAVQPAADKAHDAKKTDATTHKV